MLCSDELTRAAVVGVLLGVLGCGVVSELVVGGIGAGKRMGGVLRGVRVGASVNGVGVFCADGFLG